MKLVFSGLEHPVVIERGAIKNLEVENCHLFAGLCKSLMSGRGDEIEPYSVWDDEGKEIMPSNAMLVVSDPLKLPWDGKDLSGRLLDKMESLFMEDEEVIQSFEEYGSYLASTILQVSHQLGSDYRFAVEWGIKQYLKSFGFAVDRCETDSYLESLMKFLDFASDMGFEKLLVFINLKTFLEKTEYESFLKHAVFLNFHVLLLENKRDYLKYQLEDKTIIDQHFLEY